jgi:hypothetical protein
MRGTHLADQLHVTVLDSVVHHLDVVASALVTDPLTARFAVGFGRNALENVLDVGPGLLVTTGHDGRTITGTLLTSRDTGTDKADTLGGEVFGAAVGVWEVRVTTIDDDVSLLDAALVEEQLNEVIDWLSGHDEQHHAAWFLELLHEFLDAVCAHDALALGLVFEKTVDLGDGAVESDDGESMVGGVQDCRGECQWLRDGGGGGGGEVRRVYALRFWPMT